MTLSITTPRSTVITKNLVAAAAPLTRSPPAGAPQRSNQRYLQPPRLRGQASNSISSGKPVPKATSKRVTTSISRPLSAASTKRSEQAAVIASLDQAPALANSPNAAAQA